MKNILIAAALLVGIAACAPRVAVDKAQNIDFTKYRTFAWMQSDVAGSKNPVYYNQLATDQVESTVNAELAKKGLKETTRKPDLLIGYHFFVEEKTRTVANNNYGAYPLYGPYYGWGRWGYAGWGPAWYGGNFGPSYTQEKYEAGTVVVDMVDNRTKRLIWRGSVQNAVGDPTKISNKLAREVERIVEKFPQVSAAVTVSNPRG
ncbi:DUF4136 domain-containing protein [Fibrella sp. HMF5335]|uniref:DUF4136 domain-containing protein n=1 Tax=Fibrella rubiginis TaxID=2817060 RepID=A0A939GH51_9BACT|nr:DUF4136 domain-containing protein [Fibrella rubiginis]MBO0939057.1 DUF4136 domain-containing protein [Fibrella rubiginis]